MGSVVFDFLNDSFLFDIALQNDNYSSVSEDDLKKELGRYREYTLSNVGSIHGEITAIDYQLRVFGAQDYFSVAHLMQTAFYLDQVVLLDPILPFSRTESGVSKSMSQFLGMERNDNIDRNSLAKAAVKMKTLTPMVAANYVKFFPASYYLEPGAQIPITYSENCYSDALPEEILSVYRDKVDVRSLRKADQGWIVENALQIGRGIAIHFNGDQDDYLQIYNLFEQTIIKYDDETREIEFAMILPEKPPPTDQFQAWVNQSINQSARAHYNQLIKGMMLSSRCEASYLTTSEFTHSLLGTCTSKNGIRKHASELVLNMELPFLSNISMSDLMAVRQNDGEAFQAFRCELESKFRELRTETDREKIELKIQNIIHELSEVQVAKIEQKIKGLRINALAQTGVALGGLAGSVVTSGLSIAATVIAVANGVRIYSEYREKIKENPAYFLWRVKNSNKP